LFFGCSPLERKLQRELDNARITRLRHLSEASGKSEYGRRIAREQELSVIESVEELCTKL
jgi:hypothetical protein